MPYPPVPLLDQRKPTAYSIKRRTQDAFTIKCKELGISKSRTVEIMIEDFLKEN